MNSYDKVIDKILDQVAGKITESLKETMTSSIRDAVSSIIDIISNEKEFYRSINKGMLKGLRGIFDDINQTPSSLTEGEVKDTTQLFFDATTRIEEIMISTESATVTIMESVEKLLQEQEEAGKIIASIEVDPKYEKDLARLDAMNSNLELLLTEILTACSFQDLTGQRLKKVLGSLSSIREAVFDLYLSSGLSIKEKEKNPEKCTEEIIESSKKKAQEVKNSELKGPTLDASQADVDDLLASLGL